MNKGTHSLKGEGLVKVRLAQASDAAGIGAIYPAFLASYGHHSDSETSGQFVARLLTEPWVKFFVATEGTNNVVGFLAGTLTYSAVSQRNAFVLNDLFVRPSARRRGIAKALLAELEYYSLRNGFAKLFVEVSGEAETVIGVFKNSGYQLQPHLTLKKELNVGAPSKI